jgi:hypothetical protein
MRDGATYLEIDAKILLARLERSLFSFLQTGQFDRVKANRRLQSVLPNVNYLVCSYPI